MDASEGPGPNGFDIERFWKSMQNIEEDISESTNGVWTLSKW